MFLALKVCVFPAPAVGAFNTTPIRSPAWTVVDAVSVMTWSVDAAGVNDPLVLVANSVPDGAPADIVSSRISVETGELTAVQ